MRRSLGMWGTKNRVHRDLYAVWEGVLICRMEVHGRRMLRVQGKGLRFFVEIFSLCFVIVPLRRKFYI